MKIEGKNAVLEALNSDNTIDGIMAEKGATGVIISLAKEKNVKVQFVDKFVLDKLSVTGKHQGYIATTSDFVYCEIEDIIAGERGSRMVVVLDGVEDPHNLGSIIRVCECAGVDGIIIPKNRSASVNETVVRCSAGATEHIRVARVTNINNAIKELQSNNFWVYGADMDGDSIYDTDLNGDIVLVVGGEGSGVSQLTRKNCDKIVSLPLRGKVNSLNASVACGLVVYEAVRQRQNKGK